MCSDMFEVSARGMRSILSRCPVYRKGGATGAITLYVTKLKCIAGIFLLRTQRKKKKMSTVVVFVFHEYNRNVKFFLKQGVKANSQVDYVVVHNIEHFSEQPSASVRILEEDGQRSKVTMVKRANLSNDWGAYSESLLHFDANQYKYFVFLNSTMRGPFVPPYVTEHWTQLFTRKLNSDVGLVGSTINPYNCQPHVQSMMMAMDRRVLDLAREHQKFFEPSQSVEKSRLITEHEVGLSTLVLENGLNIDCMVTAFQGVDWREKPEIKFPTTLRKSDLWGDRNYFGHNLHVYETVFFKTNRYYNDAHTNLEHYTLWKEHEEILPELLQGKGDTVLPKIKHFAQDFFHDTEYVEEPHASSVVGPPKTLIALAVATGVLAFLSLLFFVMWWRK